MTYDKIKNSLSTKLLSLFLAMSVLLGTLPLTILSAFALENTDVAQIGNTYFETLSAAIDAATEGENCVAPREATEIKLLKDTECGFDVGKSNGSVTKNIFLDLGGNTLTLKPAVGSSGTISNGIRVLAYSKLAVSNGKIVCSDDATANIKTGIANYGELGLNNVELKSGALTVYTINNRGKLTLSGNTSVENGKVEQNAGRGDYIAITNDPYNLYYTTNVDATLVCDSADVSVGTVQIERYERTSSNKGVVSLDISNGSFDRIIEDGNTSVNVSYDLTGGTIGVYSGTELKNVLNMITPGAEYTCPENAVTIKLMGEGTFSNGFDVGTSNGKAPKNIVLDLNGKSLTLNPAVGSAGTVSNGIRVLAYSKLHIKNGTLICPDETEANIKTGIANYSELTLEDVIVKSGALTQYTINNRGKLTLLGSTKVEDGQVPPNDYPDMTGELVAITNDPYTTYNTSNDNNATLSCDSEDVVVGNIQLECYGNVNKNIVLSVSNGTFGKVFEPETTGNVIVDGSQITGGVFGSDVADYIKKNEYSIIYDSSTDTYKVNTLIGVTDFAFEMPAPLDQWVGTSYTNVAKSQVSNGTVTYEIKTGSDVAEIDATTGKLTFKKLGTVTVTAKLAQTETYKKATAEYTVTSVKIAQNVLSFPISAPTITYNPDELTFVNEASGGSGTGKIIYEIIDGSEYATVDKDTGEVTIIKAGQVTVQATKEADEQYDVNTTTYVLTINPASQADLVIDAPDSITYIKDTPQSVLSVSGGMGNGDVTYSIISGSEFATIDATTGKITTIKAGATPAGPGGIVTVKVEKAGDDCYNAATPVTKDIKINFANQTRFGFEITDDDKLVVIYNDSDNKFINKASGGQSTGTVSYEIIEGTNVADINEQTGELTIKQAGQVTVKAVKSGDTCYNATVVTYTLTVNPDAPEFTVSDVDLIYGVQEYRINVNTTLGGSGKYLYSIEGTNNIGASVDSNGKITFENSTGKVGTITVKVKKEADNQYKELEKSFNLTVSYHTTTAQPVVSGATKNESGWYTGIVTITAPDGYQISYSNELTGTAWSDAVTVNTDGNNSKKVYLKKNNEISDAISFNSIKIDTSAPANVKIDYNKSFFEKTLETITFGIYEAKTINVTLTATDTTSGVDYFTYDIGNGDVVVRKADFTKNVDGVAEYTFQISAEFRNKVKMSATDVAGWTSVFTETEHCLVVDSVSPVLEVSYDFTGSKNTLDTYYTNDDVTVKFEITDDNFDLRSAEPVFMVGSVKVALTWEEDKAAGVWKAEQLLSGDNTYNLTLTFSDASANEMNAYEKTIIIDSAAPVISSSYGTTVPVKDNIYNKARTATFTITESNFNASNVELAVTAKDITDADVDISSKGYAEYVKNPENWSHNGNIYTIVLPAFDIDAIYTVDIAYTDLAVNAATNYIADEFVIDKADATNIKVDYSTSIVDKFFETVSFGFYKADVEVTVTAEDITSGVDYFVVTYVNNDGANNSNKATYTTEKLTAVQDENNKNVFTATHKIEADARGTVTVQVVDEATNDTEKVEEYVVVADTIAPGLEYKWSFTDDQVREYNNIYYTKGKTKVKFTITEANFDLSEKPVLTVNTVAQDVTWTQIDGTDKWETEITLTGNDDYVVELSYTDRSTNAMETYTKEIHIDDVAPVFDVTYDNNEARNSNNYKADRVATVKVTEHNFKAEEVVLNVTAKDITGAAVDISSKGYAEYAKNATNWTQDGDVWTLVLPKFDIDAIYNITLNYTDLAENAATEYATEFVLDKTIANADNVTIEYSTSIVDKVLETVTFGFYKGDVQVKVTVKDQAAGVEYFEITYTQADGKNNSNKATYTTEKLTAVQNATDKTIFTAEHTIKAEARGTVSVNLIDKAGNTTGRSEEYVVVADTIAPGLDYKWTFTDDQVREYNNIYYTKGETKVKFTITEANFDLSLEQATGPAGQEETTAPAPVLTVNNVAQDITWTQIDGTDKWETEITLTGNDDYVVELSYTDRSTNAMETYTKEIHIDDVAPVFDVTYDNNEARSSNNYKADRVATVKVTEHNFKAEEVVLNVVLPPISLCGPILTIRKFSKNPMTIEKLIEYGSITREIADKLELLVKAKYNIFISGGTGSGKTTFLNALSNYIPKDERVITIEDSAELQITGVDNLVSLETRNANASGAGAVSIRDLIKSSLRMRPERIVVGEVRGGEALDMLQAMNTGHDGSLSTGHANSTEDMLSRLETMVLQGASGLPLEAIRHQIGSAIDIIIHLSRLRDKSRKTMEITEVVGYKNGEIILNPLYVFEEDEKSTLEKVSGSLVRTKNPLQNDFKLKLSGIKTKI